MRFIWERQRFPPGNDQTPLVQLADGRTDGVQRMKKGSEEPGVYGSYVHGIFDDGDIAVRIVQALADKKTGVMETGGWR